MKLKICDNKRINVQALESVGILRDDPRLKPVIEALEEIQMKNPGKIFSITNVNLDMYEFSK